MIQKESCQTCKQKGDCAEVYRDLGNTEGPPVAARAVLAFLLPLVVFIASLGISERLLTRATSEGRVSTAVSLLLALAFTFVCILATRVIRR